MLTAAAATTNASSDLREWIVAIATAVAAIGTFLAVLVALFGAQLRERWNRPRLSLSFAPIDQTTAGYYRAKRPDDDRLQEAAFARLRVSNAGKSVADEVEVLIEKVGLRVVTQPADPDPGPIEGIKAILALDALADLPLAASNSHPRASRFTLPQHTNRHVDLVLLFRGKADAHGPWILCVAPDLPDERHVLGHEVDAMELQLIVTARNADPARFSLWIKRFHGEWPLHASSVWDELSVRPLQ